MFEKYIPVISTRKKYISKKNTVDIEKKINFLHFRFASFIELLFLHFI